MRISSISFQDLYLSDAFYDINGLDGTDQRVPAPPALLEEMRALHALCKQRFESVKREEFSLRAMDLVLRVTVLVDTYENIIFVIRRSEEVIRPVGSLGYGKTVVELLMQPDLRGLVLFCGAQGAGKTSSACSFMVERSRRFGGMGVVIEDPNEAELNGVHEKGRIIQLDSSRHEGGYKALMRRAVRSGAKAMMIGEIRDEESGWEALKAGINGHMIFSTIHASGIASGIERLLTFCQGKGNNVNDVLANGLSAVIWQEIEKLGAGPDGKGVTRLRSNFLIVHGQLEIQKKIRDGKISSLGHDIDRQATRLAWDARGKGV